MVTFFKNLLLEVDLFLSAEAKAGYLGFTSERGSLESTAIDLSLTADCLSSSLVEQNVRKSKKSVASEESLSLSTQVLKPLITASMKRG